jgi:hypothetical protein
VSGSCAAPRISCKLTASMPDRLVRFTESFFEDLDDQLPEQRSASGAPSATDFLLYDLPRLRDALASGYEESTLPVPDLAPIRVLAGTGTLVAAAALYAFLDDRDHVVVVSVEIEAYPEVAAE